MRFWVVVCCVMGRLCEWVRVRDYRKLQVEQRGGSFVGLEQGWMSRGWWRVVARKLSSVIVPLPFLSFSLSHLNGNTSLAHEYT